MFGFYTERITNYRMVARASVVNPNPPGMRIFLRRLLLSSWTMPLAVTLLSVALSSGLALYWQEKERVAHESALAREITLISADLRNRLRSHAQFLRGLRAFFSVTPDLLPADWQSYTRQLELELNIPGIEAYGFAPRVQASESDAFITSIRHRYRYPDFVIKPALTLRLDESFVVVHVAPTSVRSPAAMGR